MSINTPFGFLRRVLIADAASSAAMGLLLLTLNEQISAMLSLPSELLSEAGLVLLPFAAFVAFIASRDIPPRKAVWAIMAMNAVWVVDSVLLLFSGWIQPNVFGQAFIAMQALFVLVMTELEYVGLKRSMVAAH
jgi:hypothetical protein